MVTQQTFVGRAAVTGKHLALGDAAKPAQSVAFVVFGSVQARTAHGRPVTPQMPVVEVAIGVRFAFVVEDLSAVADRWWRQRCAVHDNRNGGYENGQFPH